MPLVLLEKLIFIEKVTFRQNCYSVPVPIHGQPSSRGRTANENGPSVDLMRFLFAAKFFRNRFYRGHGMFRFELRCKFEHPALSRDDRTRSLESIGLRPRCG
uniref:(northern house mosquito) hypothetical protein n=1 Tax=Culex pipiens TaxID=7175 RepID=A0A8D8BBV9_CULPI